MRFAILIGVAAAFFSTTALANDCADLEKELKDSKATSVGGEKLWTTQQYLESQIEELVMKGKCLADRDRDFIANQPQATIASGLIFDASGLYTNLNEGPGNEAPDKFDGSKWITELKFGYEEKPLARDIALAFGEQGIRFYRGHESIRKFLIDPIKFDLYGRFGTVLENPDATEDEIAVDSEFGFAVGLHYKLEFSELTDPFEME